jgi:hypothetical protein
MISFGNLQLKNGGVLFVKPESVTALVEPEDGKMLVYVEGIAEPFETNLASYDVFAALDFNDLKEAP